MKNLLQELQYTLHAEIPITRHLGVEVAWCEPEYVTLKAPLKANINHKNTVFGGSLNALVTLAAWSMVWLILEESNTEAEIIIQDSNVQYLLPVTADFSATCRRPDSASVAKFITMLQRKGIARLELCTEIYEGNHLAVTFTGRYVASGLKKI